MTDLKDFFGIVVYTIEDYGCLNGLWSNIELNGETMNEIAKYKGTIKKEEKSYFHEGEYNVTYIENDKKIYNGTLTINRNEFKQENYYSLFWQFEDYFNKENFYFKGKGFIIGKQLIASFVKWEKEI
jgi:hypothetical protein